jgi:two-component system, NarL family, response regulator
MTNLLKLLLVEDDELFRLGLVTFLQREPTIEFVREAADGEAALQLARQQVFDLVILDLGLPGLGGLETCRQFQKLFPALPILVLTSHREASLVIKLIEVGAKGYCLKGIDSQNLILAVRSIASGATWWDPAASDQIQATLHQIAEPTPSMPDFSLTQRELEVLRLIAQGQPNSQIAKNLFITPGTVRVHVHSILQKLAVSDRTQAAILAIQRNLIASNP